jgi:hypothetical protein
MATRNYPRLWALWIGSMLVGGAALASVLVNGGDKRVFMPGPMSHGHHQIELACNACHVDAFGEQAAMEDACEGCHGDQRKKPLDSHPKKKFKDPRNADRIAKLDVLRCVTCHVEHQPELLKGAGYTQPVDFCFHCHEDIGEERPTHAGLGFETCNSAGCHNYHNNRALYTDWLLRHQDEPDLLPAAKRGLPERDFGDVLDQLMDYPRKAYPTEPLTLADADAPDPAREADIERDWLETSHAAAGVNCSACHQAPGGDGKPGAWRDKPDHRACAACHDAEVDGFTRGLHGMRLSEQVGGAVEKSLSPMTPADARLPMQPEAQHAELSCTSCHGAHRFETRTASVDACLGCHADEHSQAYVGSAHHRLWQQEQQGELPEGNGVSCATCHMPRVEFEPNDWMERILVEHNQSATLRPNEKMIRPACQHCHGLGFSIDALADPALIANNFRGRPSAHIESIDMAKANDARAQAELETR